MSKKLFEIASEIVQTQVSSSHMTASEIASSLREVFKILQEMQKSEAGGVALEIIQTPQEGAEESSKLPAPSESIQENKVVCLECGVELKQLTQKHLMSHGMSSREYKKKYGFNMRTPLAAKSVTKAKSKAAKKRGLPENLRKYQEERRSKMAQEAAAPVALENKSTGRTRLRKKNIA
jgi:predicted transcriptional regulator